MRYSVKSDIIENSKVSGRPVHNGKIIDTEAFGNLVRGAVISEVIQEFSGFFSIHFQDEENVYLATDRARTIPLFYSVSENRILVSDNFEWIKELLGSSGMCNHSYDEFLLTGYVCGSNTLHANIKQVEAGQLVKIRKSNGKVELKDYFLFDHIEPSEYQLGELEYDLREAIGSVFSRLLTIADGRQIVLPLSGGFDSRLIASTLKKFNYKNVVCFSYGKSRNKESTFSKNIADALGFPWHFVEYTSEKWSQLWFSEEATAFQIMASKGVSLPHIQDWVAVRELKRLEVVDKDAIFVPGHSGDFVAGSHIPSEAFANQKLNKNNLIKRIILDHYSCLPIESTSTFSDSSILKEKVEGDLPMTFEETNTSYANVYECWDWRERQAKYIINSVRTYEFFDFDWWLPLWDKEFVEFWCRVPLSIRKERLWYNEVVSKIYESQAGEGNRLANKNAAEKSMLRKLAHATYPLLPKFIKKRIYKKKLSADFENHFLQLGSLLSKSQKVENNKFNYTIIGVYNKLFLKNEWGKR